MDGKDQGNLGAQLVRLLFLLLLHGAIPRNAVNGVLVVYSLGAVVTYGERSQDQLGIRCEEESVP